MNSKSLLIAIAAFAVTTTGAQAYVGNKQLQRSGVPASQATAWAEARSLYENGEIEKARDLLLTAGVEEKTLKKLSSAKIESRQAILQAVTNNDFLAFRQAITGTPLADLVVTEADFKDFVTAHQYWQAGKHEEARALWSDLGLPKHGHRAWFKNPAHSSAMRLGGLAMSQNAKLWRQLSPAELEAYQTAKRANDQATARAILEAAGVSRVSQ